MTLYCACAGGLFQCAVNLGKIVSDYEMYGHRQTSNTDCPGDALYLAIQGWPHWVRKERRVKIKGECQMCCRFNVAI